MAEDDLDDEVDVEALKAAEAASAAAAQSLAKAKRMTYIMAAAALMIGVLGGGAGGYFAAGALASSSGHEEEASLAEPNLNTPTVFVDLPKVHTNIASARCRGLYINLVATVGVGSPEEAALVRTAGPIIKDGMTEYARSITKKDLDGQEGSERLRTNIEAVVQNAVQEVHIRDILFKEFLLQ